MLRREARAPAEQRAPVPENFLPSFACCEKGRARFVVTQEGSLQFGIRIDEIAEPLFEDRRLFRECRIGLGGHPTQVIAVASGMLGIGVCDEICAADMILDVGARRRIEIALDVVGRVVL